MYVNFYFFDKLNNIKMKSMHGFFIFCRINVNQWVQIRGRSRQIKKNTLLVDLGGY